MKLLADYLASERAKMMKNEIGSGRRQRREAPAVRARVARAVKARPRDNPG